MIFQVLKIAKMKIIKSIKAVGLPNLLMEFKIIALLMMEKFQTIKNIRSGIHHKPGKRKIKKMIFKVLRARMLS